MRALTRAMGLLLLAGGLVLGFLTANHYYGWTELPVEPSAGWGEMLVTAAPSEPTEFQEAVHWPDAKEVEEVEEVDAPAPVARSAPVPAPLSGRRPTAVKAPLAERPRRKSARAAPAKEDPRAAVAITPRLVVPAEPAEAPEPAVEQMPWAVKHPVSMRVGDAEQVRFVIDARPGADPAAALARGGGATTEGETQRAEVYAAEAIGGRCFAVAPAERQRVAFTTAAPMVWTWTATALEVGDDCILEIYLGGIVDDEFSPLRLEQIELPVHVAERAVLRDVLGLAGPVDDVLSLIAIVTTMVGSAMTWMGTRRTS